MDVVDGPDRDATGPQGGGEAAARSDDVAADEVPARPDVGAAGPTIRLGGHGRLESPGPDGGDPVSLGRTASGLSALGRAQARAHALSHETGEHPIQELPVGLPKRPPPGPRARPALPRPALPRVRPRRRRRRPGSSRRPWPSLRRGSSRQAGPSRRRGLHGPRRRGGLVAAAVRFLAAGVVVVVLVAAFVAVQLLRAVPRPVLRDTAATSLTVPGAVPTLPWPHSGQAAVAVAGLGVVGSAGPSTPVPIASLAKVMSVLVVLHDHPLAPGQSGPAVTMTASDQAIYDADQAAGDSVAPVVAGESLTELQLLEGLLIPSADNLAQVVADWDAGSQAAFVARMNATAASLGMRATTYADAGGVSSSTVSTAADQLRLAQAAAANPVLMSIVRQPQLSFPDSPPLDNYDTLLGQDGIVGIKTGSTVAAGGCFMFAADGMAAGRPVEVLGVVLGQSASPLITSALDASRALITAVLAGLHPVTVLAAGTDVAEVTTPWGSPVQVLTTKAVTALHFGQLVARLVVTAKAGPIPRDMPAGAVIGTVAVTAGDFAATVPAATAQPARGPSRRWRLERL